MKLNINLEDIKEAEKKDNPFKYLEELNKERQQISKSDTVLITLKSGKKIKVDRCLNTDMNKLSLIVIPKGKRLLEHWELLELYNYHREKFDWHSDGNKVVDEFVKQPLKDAEAKYPYYNIWIWFRRLQGVSILDGDGRSLYLDYPAFGVRFVQDLGENDGT